MIDCYTYNTRKARKSHTCEYCKLEISKNEKYSFESGIWEGEFFNRKLHLACKNALDDFICKYDEEDFTWEDIDIHLQEKHCKYCDNCTSKKYSHCELIMKNYQE